MARINFAWVDANETTFGPQHQREDAKVVSLDVEHEEGGFANLTIVIKNPKVGFLHISRKQWVWISEGAEPLYFGRLTAIPTSINKEAVTLEFDAKPADYQDQKEALAATMRSLPYYDAVWLTADAQLNPDTVLEARPELWHIDRVTHEVTTSHILVGEDGLEEFFPIEVPYDSVDISIEQVPVRTLQVVGDVSWDQASAGRIDLGQFFIDTYTGRSLLSSWPKPGASLEGGWSVADSVIIDNWNIDGTDTTSFSVQWTNEAAKHTTGDTLSTSISSTQVLLQGGDPIEILLSASSHSGEDGASNTNTTVVVPEWSFTASLSLAYDAKRNRHESISFVMSANFQPLITLPGDEDIELLNISGGDVGIATGLSGDVPIGDVRNRSYFTTDRGMRSLEWLILRARSQLMLSSRAVSVTFSIPWARAKTLSNRKNGRIHDHRLPGGVAEGKITKYGFTTEGSTATRIGSVTISASIGYGGTVSPVAGDPDYCDDDYVEPDYQFHTGGVVVLDASDVGYSPPAFSNDVDDGLHFPLGRSAVLQATVVGDVDAQRAFLLGLKDLPSLLGVGGQDLQEQIDILSKRGEELPKQIDAGLKDMAHYLALRLKNLNGGPFDNIYDVTLTQLELPKGIDLEAAPL